MTKPFRIVQMFTFLIVGGAMSSGCAPSCCVPVGTDAGPDGGPCDLTFIAPTDGDTLTLADDDDPLETGIQFDVEVDCADDGRVLTLTGESDQGVEEATAEASEGSARFLNFDIKASAEGTENVLTLTDGDTTEEITVTGILADGGTSCSFDTPLGGAILTVDADTDTDGFQFGFEVTCLGEEAANNTLVVNAGGADVTTTTDTGGAADGTVTAGNDAGPNTLTATLQDENGDEITSVQIMVNVNFNPDYPCLATITVPMDNAVFDANSTDESPDVGFQTTVTVDSENAATCEGESVTVTVDGTDYPDTIGADGTVSLLVTLPEGSNLISARVYDPNDADSENFDNITVFVDTVPPGVTLTSPLEGQTFDETDDTDGNPLNGISLEFAGTTVDVTEGTYDLTCTGTGSPYQDNGDITLNPDGSFTIEVDNISKPVCTLTVTVSDGAQDITETVNFTVLVPQLCAADIVSPPDGTAYSAASVDVDPGTPGLQISVVIDTGNPASCGAFMGQIEVGGMTYSAAVDGAGQANVTVTVPEGDSTLTATVTDGTVVSDVGDNVITVSVDTVPPMVAITSPAEGAMITEADDLDMNALNGIEINLVGTSAGATMASYDVVCDGASGSQSGMIPGGMDFNIALTNLDQGNCSVTVTASDGINTTIVTNNFSVAVDLPCEANIVSPADGTAYDATTVDANPILAGFQIIVVVNTNNALFCQGVTAEVDTGAGVYSNVVTVHGTAFVTVTLPEGNTTLTATVTDGTRDSTLGNNQIDVSVDRTAPDLIIASPVDGQLYGPADDLDAMPGNGISLTLSGSADGATSADYSLTCTGTGNFTQSGALTLGGGGAYSVVLADISEPNCTLTVNATDGVNDVTQVINFTVDANVSIVVTIDGDADDNGYWVASEDSVPATTAEMDADVDVTATFAAGTYTGRVDVVDPSDGSVVATYSAGALTSGVASTVTITVPFSDETAYEVQAFVDDGGAETGPAIADFVVDTQAPIFSVASPFPGFQYGLQADADDDKVGYQQLTTTTITGLGVGSVVFIDYAGPAAVSDSCLYTGGFCVADQATLVEGAWTVTLTATDAAGNVGTTARSFSVDITPPSVQAIVVAEDAAPVGVFNAVESGDPPGAAVSDVSATFDSIANGRTVTLRIDGAVAATATTNANSVTFANVSLPEGDLVLTVSTTDAAGNDQVGNDTLALTVDTITPSLVLAAPLAANLLVADDKDPITQAGLQIDFVYTTNAQNGRFVELFDGATSIATSTSLNGQVIFADVTLADGAHNITATITDDADNSSTTPAYTPTVDSIGPTLAITSPTDGASFADGDDANVGAPGFQIDFTVTHSGLEAGQDIRIIDGNGQELGREPADAGGTTVVQATIPLISGQVTAVRASGTEISGNTGNSQPISVQVNTGAYSVLLDAPALVAGMVEIGNGDDIGGNLVRFSLTVPGWSAAPMPTTVTMLIDGLAVSATVTDMMGDTIWVDRTFANGETGTVEITVEDGAAMLGTTGVQNYNTDFGDPAVAIASVTDAEGTVNNPVSEVFNIASDLNQGQAGLQVTVVVDVTDCENGTVTLQEAGTDLAAGQGPVDGSGTDSVTFNITDVSENAADWTATCTDLASNSGTGEMSTLVDITPPGTPTLVTTVVGNPRLGAVEVSTTSAPGDDGFGGDPASVFVVASRTAITLANVDAKAAGAPYPGFGGRLGPDTNPTPGAAYSTTSSFLAYSGSWNFGMVATDDVGNRSLAVATETGLVTTLFSYANVEDDLGAGAAERDYFGGMSQTGGDFNGDGFDDMAVASWNEGDVCPFAFYCHGAVRIFAGGASVGGIGVTRLLNETNVGGTANMGYLGVLIANIDGDAFDDLVVMSVDPVTFLGEIHIFYGTNAETIPGTPDMVEATPVVIDLAGLNTVGVQPRDLGDVDGDGFNDVGFTSWTAFYENTTDYVVLFGSGTRPTTGAIGAASGTRYALIDNDRPQGAAADLPLLGAATGIGDLNLPPDAFDDFVIDGHDGHYIVRGRATAAWPTPPATLAISSLPATDVIDCTTGGCGRDLSAGDVDGDGDLDLIVSQSPNVAIYKADGGGLPSTPDYTLNYTQPISFQTNSNVSVSDTNADGYDDIVVLYFVQGIQQPKVAVWLGFDYQEGTGLTAGARTSPDAVYTASFGPLFSGFASACGDLDNDGLAEICWGSERRNNGAGQGDGSLFVRY